MTMGGKTKVVVFTSVMFIHGYVLAATAATPANSALREKARSVMRLHCGACHYPVPVAANPKALKVFDLSQTHWTDQMNEKQLRDVIRRFKDRSRRT